MCNYDSKKHTNPNSEAHHNEHKQWNRRSFLQALGLAGAGTMMLSGAPLSASTNTRLAAAISASETDRVLVIIRLKGGNDGLNTIVPVYDYDTYAQSRPTIKHNLNSLINLSNDFAMPNYMSDLQRLWDNGGMKVVHSVGYENPNQSHFSSSDIWASADTNNDTQSGWISRYFEEIYPDYLTNPPEIPAAVQIGSIGNLIFEGDSNNYAFSVANPNQLEAIAQNGTVHQMTNLPDCIYGEQLEFLRGTTNTTYRYANTIHEAFENGTNTEEYLDEKLGKQLSIVARLIKGNLGTKVYMVTLGGFDTHANQAEKHEQLMTDLSNSIKKFYDDLSSVDMDTKVLSMTISEFGRRTYENGSNGTDHGTSAPLMLFGPAIQGNGFVGEHASLTQLVDDNLEFKQDFRGIYASVMENWLCINSNLVDEALLNTNHQRLDLGFNCDATTIDDFNEERFKHFVIYPNNDTIITFINPFTQHTVVKLYDIMGREISTLKNEMLLAGEHNINVKAAIKQRLSIGQYIYKITVGSQSFSKSLIIK